MRNGAESAQLRSSVTSRSPADHRCMRKPRGAEPKAAKMPSWAVSLWPKMSVYCYKLRFWGDNCSALLWPEITDGASATLACSAQSWVQWLCWDSLGKALSAFRLCRRLKAFCCHHGPSGHSPWVKLPIHCTVILNWTIIFMLVNTKQGLLMAFSSMPGQCCFPSCFWLTGSSLRVFGVYMCMLSLFCHEMNKRMTETDSLISASLRRREEKEMCEWVKQIGMRREETPPTIKSLLA